MILDFRDVDGGASLDADVCVIGAGAAGITIARSLVGWPGQVLVLESGGLELEGDTQDLYAGNDVGVPYFGLDGCRLRFFGGTTNHWANFCGPLDEVDFLERPWVPYSGWPITRQDLDPFYERAMPICGVGPFVFDGSLWGTIGREMPAFDPEKLLPFFYQIGPGLRFGEAYRDELATADNVRVLLHANVTDIRTNAAATNVEHVDIRTLEGKTGRVRAKVYVLACGGLENARLLLVSNSVEPAGLGNRNDLVGRFFMEHPDMEREGTVLAEDPHGLLAQNIGAWKHGVTYRPGWRMSEGIQRRERSLNVSWKIEHELDPEDGSKPASNLWKHLRLHGEWPGHLGETVWKVASDLDGVAANVYRQFVLGREPVPRFRSIILNCRSEQAPNPDSRVTLSEEKDALGLRRLTMDWRLSALDKHSNLVAAKTAAAELARLGMGRVKLADWLIDGTQDWPDVFGANHHIGTTRMADDPKNGVVQKDCRMHDVGNLYIAGSSVFPTAGFITPTLTIVALALRLADHLRTRLA